VYGVWPGLGGENLYQGRDLAVTTDFRSAIGTVLTHHLRLDDRQLTQVFPEMPVASPNIEPICSQNRGTSWSWPTLTETLICPRCFPRFRSHLQSLLYILAPSL
jgi:hypothetical protein